MLKIGSMVAGKYRVIHQIGKGGMSNVYLVLNETANKQWALKEIRKTGSNSEDIIAQSLITEINILKKLRHDHLPTIVDVIEDGSNIQILMDYVEGITLQQQIKTTGTQSEENVVKWMIQLAEVLKYLHEQTPPIIYRDLKPSNVMLKPNGDIVLIDFGTAKEHKKLDGDETTSLGTKGYASPEQMEGKGRTDQRTDIYSLGATAYHLLTNKAPLAYPYEFRPIREWNPNLSSGLEKIIIKCLEKNPENRYQNCDELLFDLNHYHEFEDEYIKEKKKERKRGISLIIAGSGMVAASIGLLIMAGNLEKNNYESYMQSARTATTAEDKIAAYKEAITLSPSNGEAYEELIKDGYLADAVFTKEESEDFVGVMNARNGSSSNEHILSQTSFYGQVSYEAGLAYYYYYDEDGGITMSKPYFDTASSDENLSEAQRMRASILSRIAGYYKSLNTKDRAGDSNGDYKEYYNDLVSLLQTDIAKEDNVRTALVTYKELSYQILNSLTLFREAGVSEDEMKSVAKLIEESLNKVDESDFDNTDRVLKTAATKNIKDIGDSIIGIYEGRN